MLPYLVRSLSADPSENVIPPHQRAAFTIDGSCQHQSTSWSSFSLSLVHYFMYGMDPNFYHVSLQREAVRKFVAQISFKWQMTQNNKKETLTVVICGIIISIKDDGTCLVIANPIFL
jgi:hypothetical protein